MGELAQETGETVELIVLAGTAMVLAFVARRSTKDVDIAPLPSCNPSKLRSLASQVADERTWAGDWLNDAAKGFLLGSWTSRFVDDRPGVRVVRPSTAQLLAMKPSAWRDDVGISDAAFLLNTMNFEVVDIVWTCIEEFLCPGMELKATDALDDLRQHR